MINNYVFNNYSENTEIKSCSKLSFYCVKKIQQAKRGPNFCKLKYWEYSQNLLSELTLWFIVVIPFQIWPMTISRTPVTLMVPMFWLNDVMPFPDPNIPEITQPIPSTPIPATYNYRLFVYPSKYNNDKLGYLNRYLRYNVESFIIKTSFNPRQASFFPMFLLISLQ